MNRVRDEARRNSPSSREPEEQTIEEIQIINESETLSRA